MYQLSNLPFPDDFVFAVADADLQVIGEEHTLREEGSEMTMWTHFAQKSGKVFENHTPLPGIDRFHKYPEDIKLMKDLGVKAYRTSVSMARVMTRDKQPNMKAIEWYKNYFTALKEAGMTIYVTLYHWEMPQYLSEQGGWKNPEIADYLVEHAKIVHKYLDEYIEEYFILNETFQFTFFSYHTADHAPGEEDLPGALAAVHNALLAQGKVFHALKSIDANLKISTVYNPSVTYAASSKEEDIKAAEYCFGYHTSMFTDPLYLGHYPEYMLSLLGKNMPETPKEEMDLIKVGAGLESFGVNYYRGKVVKHDPDFDIKFAEVKYPQGVVNGLGWPVSVPPTYPEAFYDLLTELYHRYGSHGMKQIWITENGTCWDDHVNDQGKVDDQFRIYYVREHLQQVQKAILAGVPIKGYFLWTLMDNYEWELGYKPGSCFGIVHVDRQTMKRTPKESFYWYKEVVKNRFLS